MERYTFEGDIRDGKKEGLFTKTVFETDEFWYSEDILTTQKLIFAEGVPIRPRLPPDISRVSDIDFRRPFWRCTLSNDAVCGGQWIIEFSTPANVSDEHKNFRYAQEAMIRYNDRIMTVLGRGDTTITIDMSAVQCEDIVYSICTVKDESDILHGFLSFDKRESEYTVESLFTSSSSFRGCGWLLLSILSRFALANASAGSGSVTLEIDRPTSQAYSFYEGVGFKKWNPKDRALKWLFLLVAVAVVVAFL